MLRRRERASGAALPMGKATWPAGSSWKGFVLEISGGARGAQCRKPQGEIFRVDEEEGVNKGSHACLRCGDRSQSGLGSMMTGRLLSSGTRVFQKTV